MLRAMSTIIIIRTPTRATTVRKSISVLFYVWTIVSVAKKVSYQAGWLLPEGPQGSRFAQDASLLF
jgi:hypothetical protein